jgi:hypothetical protein
MILLKRIRKTPGHTAVLLLVVIASPTISKDFGILTRMLYAAFLAEQGAAICAAADPAFANEIRGPMGDMQTYVQHIKVEVTAGLDATETLSLLKSAADIAKAEAAQAIRNLRMGIRKLRLPDSLIGAKRPPSHSCGRLWIRMICTTTRSIS